MTDRWNDLLDNSGLTDQQKIEFLATIDEDASLEEIAYKMEHIEEFLPELNLNANTSLNGTELTNRFEETAESLKQATEYAGVSEGTLGRMAADFKDTGAIQNLVDEQRELKEQLDDGIISSEEYKESIQDLSQEQENLENAAQSLAARNLRLNQGVEDLVSSWEGLSLVLRDDASKGTADWYEALEKIDTIMSNILDIDTGTLSNSFYQNADALNAMEAAAKGDMNAIDELRKMASQDIVQNLTITPIEGKDTETIRQELLDGLAEFQAELDNVELGAKFTVDDSEYMAQLAQLLESGAITAEQLTAILSSAGMEGTFEEDTKTVKVPSVTYRMVTEEKEINMGDEENPSPVTSYIAMVPEAGPPLEQEVTFQRFVGATFSGDAPSTVGSSSRAGRSVGSVPKKSSGGSKKSQYKPKKKDRIEEEVDRYQKVNAELSDVENTLSRINKEQERSTGFDLGDNMDKQIGLLQKQLDITKEKYKIQQQEAAELKRDLSNQFGVGFDGDGMITNYRQTLKQLEGEVNGLINKYNSTSTEEGQNALEEKIEAATERLEDFKKMYQRYDTLWSDELRQSEEAIEDLTDQIEDLRIEAFKTAIEVVDNIKDMNEAMVEFEASIRKIKSLNDDDPFGEMADSTKRLSYYFDDANGSAENFFNTMKKRTTDRAKEADKDLVKAQKQLRQASTAEEKRLAEEAIRDAQEKKTNAELANRFYNTVGKQAEFGNTGSGYLDMATYNRQMILEQVRQFEKNGTSEIFGKNSKALYDTAKEVLEQSQQMINDFADEIIELQQSILDSMDKMQEQAEELHAEYENLGDSLEHLYDITEKVQGEQSYDMLNAILDKQIANNQQYKSELENELKIWQSMEANLEKGSEAWKNAHEKVAETQKEINDLVSETFDMAQKKYENSINKITSAWTNGMMNLGKFGNGKQLGGALDNALRDENGNALFKDID